ncbi:MAG: adhesion protein FadA, partial [Leptotrichiaceae bacterium]|nr:adhesion protein FadA [Leptotrichiaceae bacterium]
MKKKLILLLSILLFASATSYSATVKNNISISLDAIEAKYDQLLEMEAQRKREFISEKGQLEVEVEDLKSKLVGRE